MSALGRTRFSLREKVNLSFAVEEDTYFSKTVYQCDRFKKIVQDTDSNCSEDSTRHREQLPLFTGLHKFKICRLFRVASYSLVFSTGLHVWKFLGSLEFTRTTFRSLLSSDRELHSFRVCLLPQLSVHANQSVLSVSVSSLSCLHIFPCFCVPLVLTSGVFFTFPNPAWVLLVFIQFRFHG